MSNREMREVFATSLKEMMAADERIVLLDADLARASATLGIRDTFPDRAFDVGIAEANMISMAAGLASYGFLPFVTTFAPFATRRVCDQLAISVCYAGQNVKIIGTDPGISAELNGGTHMGVEDIGVVRSLVNMVIFEPVDERQLALAMPAIRDYEGPMYIRLFRKKAPDVFGEDYCFRLFEADKLSDGRDVTILASGIMVQESIEAVSLLAQQGIHAELINVHTLKPIDKETILQSVKKTGCVVTAENHSTIGGLFSAVSELLAEEYPAPVVPIGMHHAFGEVGKMPYLKKRYHMEKQDIAKAAERAVERKERIKK